MIVLRLAFAVFALLSLPAMADDAVTLTQRVEYYDVRGQTHDAIARSLRRDAPRSLDGFQGQANFVFSWTYNYRPAGERHDPGLCEVVNAKVAIDIVITLPRHRRIAEAPDELEAFWNRYATAMEAHERNHARDFVAVGSRIPAALDGLIAPCRAIEDTANARGMDFVAMAQKMADDYDAATNHGETEGTVFPGL